MQETTWQSLIDRGNACYQQQQWQQAELFYSEAYDGLAFSFRENPGCIQTLMAWICACHNLATLYEATGQHRLSLTFLKVPHDYLQQLTQSPKVDESIKVLAVQGLSLTLPPILRFEQRYPICDSCKQKAHTPLQPATQDPRQCH